ncbi:MAG: hypothetical protein SCH98_11435 [Deferrisomatales bacterium]|nr:hypothetical protein [Deferrisomatales bacterium]
MIYLGGRASREGWVSFETDPLLRRTKEGLHENCLPCLTGLLEQLRAGAERVDLGPAWECWKVVALTPTREDALGLLERFSQAHPDEEVRGKVGGGRDDRPTWAVIFHTRSEARRDRLLELVRDLSRRRPPDIPTFCSRGCGIPYEELLGPWQGWEPVSPIRHPERRARVVASLRESLYGAAR